MTLITPQHDPDLSGRLKVVIEGYRASKTTTAIQTNAAPRQTSEMRLCLIPPPGLGIAVKNTVVSSFLIYLILEE